MKIAHLSDLHLGKHSDEAWKKITHILNEENPDYYVFSGDICDLSSKVQYQRFLDWIIGDISISESEERFGLHIGDEMDRIIITPGNHDYMVQSRFTSGKTDFYKVFNDITLPNWRYVEKEKEAIFFIILDSNKAAPPNIANGYICNNDLKYIKTISDKARHGILMDRDGNLLGDPSIKNAQDAIDKYKKSIKILVMHHYCILPNGKDGGIFMRIRNREEVLARVASDDFDIILCGHEHHGSAEVHKYKDVMDDRAIERYVKNYLVRQIGDSNIFPIYDIDERDKMLSRYMRMAIDIIKGIANARIISDTIGAIRYDASGISITQKSIMKGRKKFVKTFVNNRRTRRILSRLSKLIENEISIALERRRMSNVIPRSALKENEGKGFFIINIQNLNVSVNEYIMLDEDISLNGNISMFRPSEMIDLFNSKVAEMLRDEGVID